MNQIINDSANAYKGIIPADCWHIPYMPLDELEREIAAGIDFWAYEGDKNDIVGVMGIQLVKDITLIRHAYVKTELRPKGIGTQLLNELIGMASTGILIGTWRAATWAVTFYQKNGFTIRRCQSKEFGRSSRKKN
jgi:GNAT superfamily N-acetyltransferase